MPDTKKQNHVTLRGIELLQRIVNTSSCDPVSFKTLLAESGFNYSSLSYTLRQLEEDSYIEKIPHTKNYIAGKKLFHLSLKTFNAPPLKEKRTLALQKLSSTVNETCNCSLLENGCIVYLDRVEANWSINIHLRIGSKLPLNCTASGKVLLAYMDEKKREQLLDDLYLVNHTENSIVTLPDLQNELKKIRQNGYATDNEELFVDTAAISVPVFLKKNTALMAVAIQAPKFRKSIKDLKKFLPELKKTADSIQHLYRTYE